MTDLLNGLEIQSTHIIGNSNGGFFSLDVKVVDVKTGLPVPDILVLASNINLSISSKTMNKLYECVDELRSQAIKESLKGLSREQLYKNDNRVALTDEYGCYQFDFRTGITDELEWFTVIDEDYYTVPVRRNTFGREVTDVPVMELLPPQARYSPVLWFEDAAGGIITDQNILENIWIKFSNKDGKERENEYRYIIKEPGRIEYGTYCANLNYGEYNYIYEPVTINWDSPQEIFFKVQAVKDRVVVLQSRIVHGITGEPVPGAVVYVNNSIYYEPRSPEDIIKCQDIIDSIGDDFDLDNPAVQMLSKALNAVSIACTDENGEFELRVDPQYISDDPMSYLEAIERNFMSARQCFSYMPPMERGSPEFPRTIVYEPDENGVIRFSEMKLFPSAQIELELDLPDISDDGQQFTDVRFQFSTKQDDPTPWLKRLWANIKETKGASTIRQSQLRPNGRQTVIIPAGVELKLTLRALHDERLKITFDNIELEQGQSLDLGLIEFPRTFKVYVKLIDLQEKPVQGVLVRGVDSSGVYFGLNKKSDEEGIVVLNVTPNSKGEFSVSHRDNETNELIRESIPYEVRGEENAGQTFTFQLSDEAINSIFESGEAL